MFVRGTDNALWHSRWGSHGWTSWASRGGTLATAPAATSWVAMANIVQSVPYYQQQYHLSCEEAALQMAIAHQGITITQTQALNDIGIDWRQGYYSNGVLRWGNPYINFVGDPNGSEVLLTGRSWTTMALASTESRPSGCPCARRLTTPPRASIRG